MEDARPNVCLTCVNFSQMSRYRLFFPVMAVEWPTTTSTSVFFLVRSSESKVAMFSTYHLLHSHPYSPLLPSWRQQFDACFNFSNCTNTISGLKMESLNLLTTMHKDEVCMHFRCRVKVKRVLYVWPPTQEAVHFCSTFPLLCETRHSSRYVLYRYGQHSSGTTDVVCLCIKR
jgi:hypothetical protein